MRWQLFGLLWILAMSAGICPVRAESKNGFDLSQATVPAVEIKRGGPAKDGIVALTRPEFVGAAEATFLDAEDRVLGVIAGRQAKAFPVRFLSVHEIVNDLSGEQHYAVTYCPLCGTGIAFATNLEPAGALNFGVSGLLYNSDLLMYDRNTDSLWSQISGYALAGELVGTKLPRIQVWHTTWRDWLQREPGTKVMQGHSRFKELYRHNAYPGYVKSRRLYFSVNNPAPREFHPKEFVLGVDIGGVQKAYPFSELEKYDQGKFQDAVGEQIITVMWDRRNQTAAAQLAIDEPLVTTMSYWFAWYTFHPETHVFRASES